MGVLESIEIMKGNIQTGVKKEHSSKEASNIFLTVGNACDALKKYDVVKAKSLLLTIVDGDLTPLIIEAKDVEVYNWLTNIQ